MVEKRKLATKTGTKRERESAQSLVPTAGCAKIKQAAAWERGNVPQAAFAK